MRRRRPWSTSGKSMSCWRAASPRRTSTLSWRSCTPSPRNTSSSRRSLQSRFPSTQRKPPARLGPGRWTWWPLHSSASCVACGGSPRTRATLEATGSAVRRHLLGGGADGQALPSRTHVWVNQQRSNPQPSALPRPRLPRRPQPGPTLLVLLTLLSPALRHSPSPGKVPPDLGSLRFRIVTSSLLSLAGGPSVEGPHTGLASGPPVYSGRDLRKPAPAEPLGASAFQVWGGGWGRPCRTDDSRTADTLLSPSWVPAEEGHPGAGTQASQQVRPPHRDLWTVESWDALACQLPSRP